MLENTLGARSYGSFLWGAELIYVAVVSISIVDEEVLGGERPCGLGLIVV